MTRTFNLADIFEVVAQAVPDRTAFVCGPQRLSLPSSTNEPPAWPAPCAARACSAATT